MNSVNPKISVCIPCYNGVSYLDNIFESLDNQDFEDFNIFFVDDGSTDDSHKKIEEYIKRKKGQREVFLYRQENKGLAGARNALVSKANGDYIFFLDVDDAIPPTALSSLYSQSNNGEREIVTGRALVILKNKIKLPFIINYLYRNIITSGHYVKSNFCVAWGSLLKKEIFAEDKFLEGFDYEDSNFLSFIYLKNRKFDNTKKVVYYYHRRDGSLSDFSEKNNWKVIDMYEQVAYAYSLFERDDLFNKKGNKRIINGVLFGSMPVVYWLSKYYTSNKVVNVLPQIAFLQLLDKYKMKIRFSKTYWKSYGFFYIKKAYSCARRAINKNRNIFEKFFFQELGNIGNKKNSFCFIDDVESNEKVITDNKKVLFLSLEKNSVHKNVLCGMKTTDPSSVENKNKIHFADLREMSSLSEDDVKNIQAINTRIILFVKKEHADKIGKKINIFYC